MGDISELAKRMVHRMMQFRGDRARALIAAKSFDLDGPPELSRFAEAEALIAIVRAFGRPEDCDGAMHSTEVGYMHVMGLGAGHVLTDVDVAAIEKVLADHNDALADAQQAFDLGRKRAFDEIGGAELVAAVEAMDAALVEKIVAGTMAKIRAKTAEHQAETDALNARENTST